MASKIVTQPATEPVTLAEVKEYLRLDGSDHDDLLTSLIASARQWCEMYQNRAYITQTWETWLDRWHFPIRLARAPLGAVSYIKYYTSDNTEKTWAVTEYQVDAITDPARINLAYNVTPPNDVLRPMNAIVIRYTTGYGAAANVPDVVKLAIKMIIAFRFENPEHDGVPDAVKYLLMGDRVVPV
jgi:uncharacterized phiE125 gp8 family phage protein